MASDPQFPIAGNLTIAAPLTAANTALDGTGTSAIIGTAGSSGAYLYSVKAFPSGDNSGSGVSTIRIFLNNGSATSDSANNILIAEGAVIGAGVAHDIVNLPLHVNINMRIPANWRVLVVLAKAQAGGWKFFPVMEDI